MGTAYEYATGREPLPGYPRRCSAQEVDRDDTSGTRVYRLSDERGYTHRYDTVRVRHANASRYVVDQMTRTGWSELLGGDIGASGLSYATAVWRAFCVLMGEGDHG